MGDTLRLKDRRGEATGLSAVFSNIYEKYDIGKRMLGLNTLMENYKKLFQALEALVLAGIEPAGRKLAT